MTNRYAQRRFPLRKQPCGLWARNPLELPPGGVVRMELSQHKVALFDLADLPYVAAFRWSAVGKRAKEHHHHIYYAQAGMRDGRGRHNTLMHIWLMGPWVDHINHDGLDNRRANLRRCTQQENMRNQQRSSRNTTGFKGVHLFKRTGAYTASLAINRKSIHLGYFKTAEEAAHAYDKAAREHFGEFAQLNFPVTH